MIRFVKILMPKIFSHVASFATLVGFLITLQPNWRLFSVVQWIMLIVSALFFTYTIISEISQAWNTRIRRYPKESPKIKQYMRDWLRTGGRCAIFSRDMTWAEVSDVKSLLIEKSRKGELTIFMPKSTILVEELVKIGAEFFRYDSTNHSPRSRFTVIHWKQDGSRVAVGRPQGAWHEIREYDVGTDPITAVVQDLLDIVEQMNKSHMD